MPGAGVSVLGHPAMEETEEWHELWTLVKGPGAEYSHRQLESAEKRGAKAQEAV